MHACDVGPVTLRLNTAEYKRLTEERGWHSQAEQQRNLGMDASSISRLLRGRQRVGSQALASLMRAFPEEFSVLVEIVPLETEKGRAA